MTAVVVTKLPVGTVCRQDEEDGGYTLWACVLGRYTRNRFWWSVWATEPHLTGFVCGDYQMAGTPVVGAMPGTPAWDAWTAGDLPGAPPFPGTSSEVSS